MTGKTQAWIMMPWLGITTTRRPRICFLLSLIRFFTGSTPKSVFLRFDISSRWNVKHSTIEHPKCRAFHKHTCRNIVAANIAMMLQGYHLIHLFNAMHYAESHVNRHF